MSSTMDSKEFILRDNWPAAATLPEPPQDGFVGLSYNVNSGDANAYRPGTKCTVWNDGTLGNQGWSTFVYVVFASQGSDTASLDAGDFCVAYNTTSGRIYDVSNASTDGVLDAAALGGAALGPAATGSCGWIWCGGVAPEDQPGLSNAMGGTFSTDGNVVAGCGLVYQENATTTFVLAPLDDDVSTDCVGFAFSDDA